MASIVVNSISLPKHCSIYICAPQLLGADCFMQHFLGLIKTKLTKNAHKGSMLCIVQLGRSINIQRLAFATISNLINGESSIQLRVDELVSSLGLTIFTIIRNSANGGSSIQLLVDELARKSSQIIAA